MGYFVFSIVSFVNYFLSVLLEGIAIFSGCVVSHGLFKYFLGVPAVAQQIKDLAIATVVA